MEQYKFNILNKKTNQINSGVGFGTTEEAAREDAVKRYVDIEALDSEVTPDQVEVLEKIGQSSGGNYYECEGCSA